MTRATDPTPDPSVSKGTGDRAGRRRVRGVWFERELFESAAFRALRGVASVRVLLAFMLRRRLQKTKGGRDASYRVTNNGEIVLPYREAERRLGIPGAAFRRAIDDLVRVGFLDIAERGNGVARTPTLYGLSERWRRYGHDDFVERARTPERRGLGFQGCRKEGGEMRKPTDPPRTHTRRIGEALKRPRDGDGQGDNRGPGDSPSGVASL